MIPRLALSVSSQVPMIGFARSYVNSGYTRTTRYPVPSTRSFASRCIRAMSAAGRTLSGRDGGVSSTPV